VPSGTRFVVDSVYPLPRGKFALLPSGTVITKESVILVSQSADGVSATPLQLKIVLKGITSVPRARSCVVENAIPLLNPSSV